MRVAIFHLPFLVAMLCVGVTANAESTARLSVNVAGVRNDSGAVRCGLYSSPNGFREPGQQFRGAVVPIKNGPKVGRKLIVAWSIGSYFSEFFLVINKTGLKSEREYGPRHKNAVGKIAAEEKLIGDTDGFIHHIQSQADFFCRSCLPITD